VRLLLPETYRQARQDEVDSKVAKQLLLAHVLGPAFQLPEQTVHSTQAFQEGWWVVECQWYDLIQVSHRGYRLLPSKVLVLVNSMIRLPGIKFEKVVGRAAANKKFLLSELEHNRLLACC
jgi:hypothetical protein